MFKKLRLKMKARRLANEIRITQIQVQECTAHAAFYQGEVLPRLSLEYANTMLELRHKKRTEGLALLGQIGPC